MSVERAVTRHDVYNLVLEHEAAFHAVVGADAPGEVKIVVITHGGADLKKVKRELRSTFFKKGIAGLRYRFKMVEGPSGGYRESSPVRTYGQCPECEGTGLDELSVAQRAKVNRILDLIDDFDLVEARLLVDDLHADGVQHWDLVYAAGILGRLEEEDRIPKGVGEWIEALVALILWMKEGER